MGELNAASIQERKKQINKKVGARIRQARTEAGLTTTKLGKLSNISNQQISCYESGKTFITVSILELIAGIVNKPITYFLEDLDLKELSNLLEAKDMKLIRSYKNIKNKNAQKHIFNLIKSLNEKED